MSSRRQVSIMVTVALVSSALALASCGSTHDASTDSSSAPSIVGNQATSGIAGDSTSTESTPIERESTPPPAVSPERVVVAGESVPIEDPAISPSASASTDPISITARLSGTTLQVTFAGGAGEYERGVSASLRRDDGTRIAILIQSIGGEPASWSPPSADLAVPSVAIAGAGPDTYSVLGIASGRYDLCIGVEGSNVCTAVSIR